jgi:hypothetical protein
MNQSELAEALGISQSMVSRLIQRGMPEDPDGARRWRARNLNVAQRKRSTPGAVPHPPALDAAEMLAPVRMLAEAALELLALGRAAEVEGALRAALRAVPRAHRVGLTHELPGEVWGWLLQDLTAWRRAQLPASSPEQVDPVGPPADDSADRLVAYELAAGELATWSAE